jgi:uncharacterized protein YoxC
MANEVKVKIIMDDDGTIRLTENSAKKLASTLNKTGKSAKDVEKNIKGAAKTASSGGKQFAGLARGAGGVVAAYATLAAQVFAVDAAFRFLKEGADLTRLYEGQIALAAATGTSYRNLAKDIQAATDSQISFKEAAQSAAIGKAAGLTNEQLVQLGKTANEVSAVLGRDLTDSFNRLVRGVTKAEPELLDELGIILRLREATENYKEATGSVGELTAFQRTQAVTNEVLTQAEEKYGKLLSILQPTENSVARLGTVFEELVDDFQVFLAKGLTPVLETLSEFPQLIALAFGPFATKIVGAAIEPLSKAGKVVEEFADKTKTASATSATLAKEQKAAAVGALQTSQQRAQGIAAQIASENKLRKGSLIKRIAEQETLEKKQLQRFIRNLQKGSNANAIASDKIRADFIKALKAMEAQSGVTTVTLRTRFKAWAASGAAAFASIKASAVSTFATIVSTGTKALAVLSTVLSVASYIGLAIAVAGIVSSFFRAEKQIDKTAQALERLEEKLASVTEESQKFSAVQNELFGDLRLGGRVVQNFGGILESFSGEEIAKSLEGATAGLKQYTLQNKELIEAEEKRIGNLQKLKKDQEELSTFEKFSLAAIFSGGGLEGGEGVTLVDPETTVKQIETVQDKIVGLQKRVTSEFLKTEEASQLFTREQLAGLGIITNELETLQKIENQYFRNSKKVKAYEKEAKKALKGTADNFDAVVETRAEYQAFVAILREEQSIRDDINKKFSAFETAYLNVSEERAILSSLFQQRSLIAQQKALGEELNQEQQEFVDTANKKIEILERELDLQTRIQLAQKELENFTNQSLIGRTKLFAEEIKFRSSIRKSNIEIAKLEGERAQIQSILTDKFQEQTKLEEKIAAATGDKKEALQADLQASEAITNASAQQLENIRLGVEAQEIKIEGLERELNLLAQIGDATKQALETSLSANIRDAILNKQDSIRDAFLNIVNSVAAAAANELANSLTKSLLSAIPGFDKQDPVETAISENSSKLFDNTNAIRDNTMALTGPKAAMEPSVLKAPGSDSTVQTKDVAQAAQSQAVAAAAAPDTEKKGFFATFLGRRARDVEGFSTSTVDNPIAGETEEVVARTLPGKGLLGGLDTIFSSFKEGIQTMFAKDGGFLTGLSDIFSGGIDGFSQIFSGIGEAFGGLFGGGGGGGGGGFNILSLFGFGGAAAMGGVFKGGIQAYAKGGVVDRPTLGLVGEGSMNEAVVPLPDGKAIPVNMNGTNNNNNVAVNINMSTGQSDTTGNSEQLAAFGNGIVDIVQREIADQTRPGGLLAR